MAKTKKNGWFDQISNMPEGVIKRKNLEPVEMRLRGPMAQLLKI